MNILEYVDMTKDILDIIEYNRSDIVKDHKISIQVIKNIKTICEKTLIFDGRKGEIPKTPIQISKEEFVEMYYTMTNYKVMKTLKISESKFYKLLNKYKIKKKGDMIGAKKKDDILLRNIK